MTRIRSSLTALALALAIPAGLAADESVLDRASSRRSFEIGPDASRARLVVDNVFGRVVVRSHAARRIDLELDRTVLGRSAAQLERANREVALEVTADGGLVDLYVAGPFRHPDRREWSRSWRDPGYRVVYDFELTVPRDIDVEIKTVDGGTVKIAGIRGSFDVANVNGGVEMSAIAGSGSVKTVNGPVRVEFDANPVGDSSFVTVNGDVEIFFPADLNADLEMHSSFGELWSEFEARPLASRPAVETVHDGHRIIRADRGTRVRIGAGGPTHSLETLNGDVLIRRAAGGVAAEDKR